ncbi:MAG: alpha/beta fold hydrolase [Novosphingobium sp.]|nr:alpha/beta fold hydrolase [Novosphingobium sp.]
MLIRAGNRRIHYDLAGPDDGPVVCLLHSLSQDMGVWAEQLPVLLGEGYRVLRPDMRGHGGSDASDGSCTMAELAEDVALVLDFLEVEKLHLIGLSIGGMIAQCFAIAHGDRLHSLMLSGTSPERLAGGMESLWQPRFDAMNAAGSLEPLADSSMERWVTDAFRPRRPKRWQQLRETVAATSLEGYRAGAIAIENYDVTAGLPSVTVPTLVVCGDEDTGTPPAGNRKIAKLIPGARYVEMPNARHFPMVEYPETFAGIMLDWLREPR